MKKEKRYKHSDFTPNLYVVLSWAMLPIALIILWGVITLCFSMT
jgi:hypothetical protein